MREHDALRAQEPSVPGGDVGSGAGHTPGPRVVVLNDRGKFFVISEDDTQNGNASIARFYGPDAEANAALDAAAPDLLEAAKTVLADLLERIDTAPENAVPVFDGIAELHDAINKATRAKGDQ